MEIQQGISFELNQQKTGKTFKVLFDKKEGNNFIGRTEFDSPEVDNEVIISAKDNFVRIGDFANVTIESAGDFDLTGKIVEGLGALGVSDLYGPNFAIDDEEGLKAWGSIALGAVLAFIGLINS